MLCYHDSDKVDVCGHVRHYHSPEIGPSLFFRACDVRAVCTIRAGCGVLYELCVLYVVVWLGHVRASSGHGPRLVGFIEIDPRQHGSMIAAVVVPDVCVVPCDTASADAAYYCTSRVILYLPGDRGPDTNNV